MRNRAKPSGKYLPAVRRPQASEQAAQATTPTPAPNRARECPECGADMTARHPSAKFCDAKCRDNFSNREKERGAILYRLKMAERYQRKHPKARRLLSVMNRLCAQWRYEDMTRRDARPSWGDWNAWIEANPWAMPK